MPIETVLFDLDGTIIDSEAIAAQAVKKCFSEWNHHLSPEESYSVAGVTWERASEILFQKFPPPIPHSQAKDILISAYESSLEKNLQIIPGVVEAIQDLHGNFKLGLVSGSFRSQIHWALKKLDVEHLFEIILGAEDYPSSKPAADGYLKAMKFFNAAPQSCLVFEDSAPGIRSGRAAGAWVIAITCSNFFGHDQSEAHWKIQDFASVQTAWIKNLSLSD